VLKIKYGSKYQNERRRKSPVENSLNYKRLLQGNYSKLILFIALIVVVALPSLAIGYSMGKNNSENLYSEIPLSPSPTQSPTPSPSPTPTALPEINTTQANPNYGKIALT
jgi:hypothetical protein